jgi:hypothetical protein
MQVCVFCESRTVLHIDELCAAAMLLQMAVIEDNNLVICMHIIYICTYVATAATVATTVTAGRS